MKIIGIVRRGCLSDEFLDVALTPLPEQERSIRITV